MTKQQRKRKILAQSLSFLNACKRWIIGEEDGSGSLTSLNDELVRGMEPLPIWAAPEPGLSFPLFWMPEKPLQQALPLQENVPSPQPQRRFRRSTCNLQRGLCVSHYAARRSRARRSSQQRRLLQRF